jgi:hypothetical protein
MDERRDAEKNGKKFKAKDPKNDADPLNLKKK